MDIKEINRLLGIVAPEKKAAIEDKITECLEKIEQAYSYKVIQRPKVLYDLRGHTAGWATRDNTIRLNVDLIETEWENVLNQTLPHEVAHIAQFKLHPTSNAHGREWAAIMHILGLPADRCHNYDTVPARNRSRPYTYHCYCMEHKVTKTLHDRMQRGRIYTCKKCGTKLTEGGFEDERR